MPRQSVVGSLGCYCSDNHDRLKAYVGAVGCLQTILCQRYKWLCTHYAADIAALLDVGQDHNWQEHTQRAFAVGTYLGNHRCFPTLCCREPLIPCALSPSKYLPNPIVWNRSALKTTVGPSRLFSTVSVACVCLRSFVLERVHGHTPW